MTESRRHTRYQKEREIKQSKKKSELRKSNRNPQTKSNKILDQTQIQNCKISKQEEKSLKKKGRKDAANYIEGAGELQWPTQFRFTLLPP